MLIRYVYWQYDKMMTDQITGEPELAHERVHIVVGDAMLVGIAQSRAGAACMNENGIVVLTDVIEHGPSLLSIQIDTVYD